MTGITVTLLSKQQTGTDAFNRPTYSEISIPVENVLVAPVSEQEVLDTLNLTGRRAEYQLAIPKGDPNIWEGQRVQFFGETWRVIGKPIRGIEALIPLEWNQKVTVESCCGKVEN